MKRKIEKSLKEIDHKNPPIKVTTTAINWDDYIKISTETNDLYLFDLQYLPTSCLTPSHFLSLQAYLNTHAEITTIKISNASNQSIVLLSAVIADNTTLIAIDLSCNKMSAEDAKHIAVALAKNATLTSIDLGGNQLGTAGAKHVASALTKNTTLTSIVLVDNQLGAASAKHLASALTKNTTLTSIYLGINYLDSVGAKHLASALTKNSTLISISLWGNRLRAAGAKHLATALTKNTTLTSIYLASNQLGTAGAKHLLEAILKNTVCTTIELSNNDIDKKLLNKINQQLNINKQRKKLPATTKTLCLALQHGNLFAKKTVVIPKGLRKHLIKKIVGHAYELTSNQVDQLLLRPK